MSLQEHTVPRQRNRNAGSIPGGDGNVQVGPALHFFRSTSQNESQIRPRLCPEGIELKDVPCAVVLVFLQRFHWRHGRLRDGRRRRLEELGVPVPSWRHQTFTKSMQGPGSFERLVLSSSMAFAFPISQQTAGRNNNARRIANSASHVLPMSRN